MRHALMISLVALAPCLLLTGCKTSIPADFEAFVPEEFSGEVQLAVQTSGEDFGAEIMLIIGYAVGVDEAKLDAAYTKQLEGAGFTILSECLTEEGGPSSRDFIKGTAEHVQVYFRLHGGPESGPTLNLFHSSKANELRMPESCTFTDAAKELCASLDGETCTLGE